MTDPSVQAGEINKRTFWGDQAFAAIHVLSDLLNKAMWRGQTFSFTVSDGGFSLTVEQREKPAYKPGGVF